MNDCSTCKKKPHPATPYNKTPCRYCETQDDNSFILPEIIRDDSASEIKINVLKRLASVFSTKTTKKIAFDILKEPKITAKKLSTKHKISTRQAERIKSTLVNSIPEIFA